VTLTGGDELTFAGFDLLSIGGTVVYSVLGFLGGVPVLSQFDHSSAQLAWLPIASVNSSVPLTSLEIVVTPGFVRTLTYGIDNIVVSAVPEPDNWFVVPWLRRQSIEEA
jgi:hypothetical protein